MKWGNGYWTPLEEEVFERLYSLGADEFCAAQRENMKRLRSGEVLVVRRYLNYDGQSEAFPDMYFVHKKKRKKNS